MKCSIKELGIYFINLGSFAFFGLGGAYIRPQIRPWKIPALQAGKFQCCHDLLSSAIFFFKFNSFRNIRVSNNLDPDQARCCLGQKKNMCVYYLMKI